MQLAGQFQCSKLRAPTDWQIGVRHHSSPFIICQRSLQTNYHSHSHSHSRRRRCCRWFANQASQPSRPASSNAVWTLESSGEAELSARVIEHNHRPNQMWGRPKARSFSRRRDYSANDDMANLASRAAGRPTARPSTTAKCVILRLILVDFGAVAAGSSLAARS